MNIFWQRALKRVSHKKSAEIALDALREKCDSTYIFEKVLSHSGSKVTVALIADPQGEKYVVKVLNYDNHPLRDVMGEEDPLVRTKEMNQLFFDLGLGLKPIHALLYQDSLITVTQYVPGSYIDFWDEEGQRYDPDFLVRCRRLVEKLHSHELCHGDLNEFNFVVREDGEPILIDVDAAFFFEESEKEFAQLVMGGYDCETLEEFKMKELDFLNL